eukprot:2754605-Alexandrium_andersonii.AAC.1
MEDAAGATKKKNRRGWRGKKKAPDGDHQERGDLGSARSEVCVENKMDHRLTEKQKGGRARARARRTVMDISSGGSVRVNRQVRSLHRQ